MFLHSDYANYDEGVSINFTNTKNPEIDALLDETREVSTDNDEVWDGNHRDIVPILNEELPYIWLFRTPHALVANADVEGSTPPASSASATSSTSGGSPSSGCSSDLSTETRTKGAAVLAAPFFRHL